MKFWGHVLLASSFLLSGLSALALAPEEEKRTMNCSGAAGLQLNVQMTKTGAEYKSVVSLSGPSTLKLTNVLLRPNFWAKGNSLIEGKLDQVRSDSEEKSRDFQPVSPRKAARILAIRKVPFSFYHHLGTFEMFDGDNDSFLLLNGQILDLECHWENESL